VTVAADARARRAPRIRPARLKDAQGLAPLCGQLGYPSTPEEVLARLRRILADPLQAVYVAEIPGRRLVGWIHIFPHVTVESDPCAELGGLVVEEGQRSRGLGGRLMEQAERWARERGYRALTLRSNVLRARAHAFYERLGYASPKSQRVFSKPLRPSR
jgi:GNAT superfamily N-acetyltransferase